MGSHRDTLLGRILLGLAFHQAGQDRGYAPQAVPPRRGCARARPLHQGLLGGVPVGGEPVTAEVGAGTDVGFHERREELVRALLHGGVLLQGGWSRSLEHEVPRRVVQTGHHGQRQVHEGTPPFRPRVTALLEPIGRILGVGRHLDELTKDRAEETTERSRLGDLREAPHRRAELAASLGGRRDEEVKEDGKKVAGVLGDGGRLTLRNLRGEPVGPVLQERRGGGRLLRLILVVLVLVDVLVGVRVGVVLVGVDHRARLLNEATERLCERAAEVRSRRERAAEARRESRERFRRVLGPAAEGGEQAPQRSLPSRAPLCLKRATRSLRLRRSRAEASRDGQDLLGKVGDPRTLERLAEEGN